MLPTFVFTITSYKKVYIAPDMTKLERAKHKKFVDELKGVDNRVN